MNKKRKSSSYCQYFYLETFHGNDIVFHLVKEVYEVHVVTGIPNYRKGKFSHEYGLFK